MFTLDLYLKRKSFFFFGRFLAQGGREDTAYFVIWTLSGSDLFLLFANVKLVANPT